MRFVELAELSGNPCEILNLELLLTEGVTLIGVEAGGDTEEVGVKLFQFLQCLRGGLAPSGVGAVGRHGVVVAIVKTLGASAGVGRVLVDGEERGAFDLVKDVLGTVAVVHVEIKHRHFLDAGRTRGEGGDGYVVEVAKPHGSLLSRVMPRRAQKGEVGFAGAGEFQCAQGAADGAARVGADVRVVGCVAIQRPERIFYEIDVSQLMCA